MSGREALCHLFSSRDPGVILQQFQLLAADAKRVVAAQPALVRVRSPAKLFGDVHGQLRDLLCLFREFGFPSHRGGDVEVVSYVFNGDFVDRGEHQLEVVALLFALKVSFPTRIWLLRGNHEFRWMNEESMGEHGYAHACRALFPLAKFRPATPPSPSSTSSSSSSSSSSLETAAADDANADARTYETTTRTDVSLYYEWSHEVFDWLPLAALVGPPTAEPVLVLHGGIGDGSWGLEQLRSEVPRPLKDEDDAALFVKHALCESVRRWLFFLPCSLVPRTDDCHLTPNMLFCSKKGVILRTAMQPWRRAYTARRAGRTPFSSAPMLPWISVRANGSRSSSGK